MVFKEEDVVPHFISGHVDGLCLEHLERNPFQDMLMALTAR